MDLITKNTKIEIVATMGNISKLKQNLGEKNLKKAFAETLQNLDTDNLGIIISTLSTKDMTFKAACDFMTEFMAESDLSILFDNVAMAVNEAGFFGHKFSPSELTEELTKPQIDIQALTTQTIEKQIAQQMPTISKKK